MATRRLWVVEEREVDGQIAHRQSAQTYTENEDGSWHWDRPDERLTNDQKAEWDRVMALLANVNGEDLRHIVCATGLMDHCHGGAEQITDYE